MLLHVLTVWLSFFLVTSTTEIYTLSLHDALPISSGGSHAPHLEAERAAAFIWKRMRRTLGVAPAAAPQPGLGRGDRPRRRGVERMRCPRPIAGPGHAAVKSLGCPERAIVARRRIAAAMGVDLLAEAAAQAAGLGSARLDDCADPRPAFACRARNGGRGRPRRQNDGHGCDCGFFH